MPDFPITERLVTLQNSGFDPLVRTAICDHIMEGYMGGTYARFNNPKEEVSAHFGISRKGEVVQYVSLLRWSYANGIMENPDLTIPWLAACYANGVAANQTNPNRRTISIEHEGFSSGSKDAGLTETQYQATVKLHRWIMELFPSILPDRKHIVGHYQITGLQRANCPGPLFPWSRLIGDLHMSFQAVPGNFAVPAHFSTFWWSNGGLPIFGYPISSYTVASLNDGRTSAYQWFERARFELHSDGTIQLGLVGSEAKRAFEANNGKL